MPINRPKDAELVQSVIEYLSETLKPQLVDNKALYYNTLVAINVLKIVERSLLQGDEYSKRETELLGQLLKTEGTLDELNEMLIAQIDNGEQSLENKQLIETLLDISMAKVAIDNPKYSTYKKLSNIS